MKNWLFYMLVPSAMFLCCKSSTSTQSDKINGDTLQNNVKYLEKYLQEYDVDQCLSGLLSEVIRSNKKYFNPQKMVYEISTNTHTGYGYFRVQVVERHAARDLNYKGIVRFKSMNFLCTGDIENNSLFKIKKFKKIKVFLVIKKENPKEIPVNIEPSIQGTFNGCNVLPLHIEVYTDGLISGDRLHIKP